MCDLAPVDDTVSSVGGATYYRTGPGTQRGWHDIKRRASCSAARGRLSAQSILKGTDSSRLRKRRQSCVCDTPPFIGRGRYKALPNR
jgi:hypothetical protein